MLISVRVKGKDACERQAQLEAFSTTAQPQTEHCAVLPALLVWLSRRPPVGLNLISVTDQLIHSISKHIRALAHVSAHTQPSLRPPNQIGEK